jgi:hypothetical protein
MMRANDAFFADLAEVRHYLPDASIAELVRLAVQRLRRELGARAQAVPPAQPDRASSK